MKNKNIRVIIFVVLFLALLILICKKNAIRYSVDKKITSYDLGKEKYDYLNYLKKYITPYKLVNFIDNDSIAFSIYDDNATGEAVINQMEFDGYKYLFKSLFDKNRIDFDDCPVTETFKKRFNTNLFNYFNLEVSDDSTVNCMLNYEDNSVAVEVYGNFKNTEPTYWTTHHFKYTLDKDGNVDDVTFEYTE